MGTPISSNEIPPSVAAGGSNTAPTARPSSPADESIHQVAARQLSPTASRIHPSLTVKLSADKKEIHLDNVDLNLSVKEFLSMCEKDHNVIPVSREGLYVLGGGREGGIIPENEKLYTFINPKSTEVEVIGRLKPE